MFTHYLPAMTSASDRPPLEREAIVAAARELISVAGLEALSLRRLAARLGVTAAAIYAHVRDKRDLLRGVAEVEFAALVADYERTDTPDPVERMRAHARAYIDYARREPELFRVMFLFPPGLRDAHVPDDIELPAATAAFGHAAGAVEAAAASGALRTDDPLLATLVFWAATHGVATVLQLGLALPTELEDRLAAEVVDRLLAGYRSPSS